MDGGVVSFGAAGGEDEFRGGAAQESGDLMAGLFDGLAGILAGPVGAGGVAIGGGEEGEHRLHNGGVGGRRRVVVEVDHSEIVAAAKGDGATGNVKNRHVDILSFDEGELWPPPPSA